MNRTAAGEAALHSMLRVLSFGTLLGATGVMDPGQLVTGAFASFKITGGCHAPGIGNPEQYVVHILLNTRHGSEK